jgi:hypothetical protein
VREFGPLAAHGLARVWSHAAAHVVR